MKERMFSIGDNYWIENEHGRKVFNVDGKALRLRDTLRFEDEHGRELYHITAKMVDVRETMVIEDHGGRRAAVVHNAWFSPIRDKWQIDVPGGGDLTAVGNILSHEYEIRERGRRAVAVISKRWIALRDCYTVDVEGGHDPALILAIVTVIDQMAHEGAPGTSSGSALDVL
jgi:uncharacterized protein YxjI